MKQIFKTKRYGLIIETVCTPADGKKVNKPVVQVHVTAPNKVGFLQLKELHAYLVETLVGGNGIEPKLLMDGSLTTRRSSWSIKTSKNGNTISVEIMVPVSVNAEEFITPFHGKLAIFLGNSLGDQDANTTSLIAKRPTAEFVVFKHHHALAAETANLMVIPQSLHTLPISGLHSPDPKIRATLLIAKVMDMGPTTSNTSLIVRITLAALSGSFQVSCHPTLSNAHSKLVVLLKKGLVYQHTDEKDIQAHVEPTCKKTQLRYGNFSKRLHYK